MNITNADQEQTLGCISGKESLLISPIIHWSEKDVWEFLNEVIEVPHCSLYDEGWHRLGCIGCPMSSRKQKMIENQRYPHVKRNWIKAIKAIRNGGVFKGEYIWWNIRKDWMPLRNVRGLLRTQAATSSIPTRNIGWGIVGSPNPRYVIAKSWLQTPAQFLPKGHLESKKTTEPRNMETCRTRVFRQLLF